MSRTCEMHVMDLAVTYREAWHAEERLKWTLAKQLRLSAKYHKPNPLGGPARFFDACARVVRAHELFKSLLVHARH